MPRPHTDPNQKANAYLAFKKLGARPSAIREELVRIFRESETVSLRTISTWVSSFKARATALDDPFEWHRMGDYEQDGWGLSWEAGAFVLEMSAFVRDTISEWKGAKGEEPKGLYDYLQPTVRHARWWWRLRLAAPSLDHWGVWTLGVAYAFREIAHEVLDLPLDLKDLDAYVASRGWESDQAMDRYRQAVNQGDAPTLLPDNIMAKAVLRRSEGVRGIWVALPQIATLFFIES